MDTKALAAKAADYIQWEEHAGFRGEVEQLLKDEDWNELNERFWTELSFGTGGIRGVMGGGFNRMNSFMVQRASEGLARYVEKGGVKGKDGKLSIVIAYDSRNNSQLFAENAAQVFAAHGILVHIFPELRPTPELSFAVRRLGASAGVVVTASHNPKKYNGYKVYWNDGAQVIAPADQGIIDEVRMVTSDIKRISIPEAEKQGLLHWIGADMDQAFIAMSRGCCVRPELLKSAKGMKIVFTALHGTGYTLVEPLADQMGFDLTVVPEQVIPSGDFPTVVSPNPEEASALKLAIELAKTTQAGIVIATDPDADRVGIAVAHGGDLVMLNGNQHGVLLTDYVFGGLKETGKLPQRPAFVNTIVTTELQRAIARSYGAEVYQVLTGFKWIAAKMAEFEKQPGGPQYVMGGEESYGFLIGTEVRDKDAITATLLTIEMAVYWNSKGKTLVDRLGEIYRQHGFYQEVQISKEFEGSSGVAKIQSLMKYLRANPPASLGGSKVMEMKDIANGTTTTVATRKVAKDIDLPSSDVLQFVLEDGSIISARPSGTEPKIKFYASVAAAAGQEQKSAESQVKAKIDGIKADIEAIIKAATA
jgi:phosphoglucomutase